MSKTENWLSRWPAIKSKNDLRGVKLGIYAEYPPEDTTKKGMHCLIMHDIDKEKNYNVLVTQQDIQAIVDIVSAGKFFTFDNADPWANVQEYVVA